MIKDLMEWQNFTKDEVIEGIYNIRFLSGKKRFLTLKEIHNKSKHIIYNEELDSTLNHPIPMPIDTSNRNFDFYTCFYSFNEFSAYLIWRVISENFYSLIYKNSNPIYFSKNGFDLKPRKYSIGKIQVQNYEAEEKFDDKIFKNLTRCLIPTRCHYFEKDIPKNFNRDLLKSWTLI